VSLIDGVKKVTKCDGNQFIGRGKGFCILMQSAKRIYRFGLSVDENLIRTLARLLPRLSLRNNSLIISLRTVPRDMKRNNVTADT